MKRQRMKARVDRKMFSKTADRTKAINVNVPLFRGGIRF